MRARLDGNRGFTLVEMMVAMALLSVIIGGMFSGISAIGRAQASSASVNLAQNGVRAAFEMMSRDIEMAAAGAKSGTITFANGTPTTTQAIVVTDSSTGPDKIDLVLVDPTAAATLLVSYGGVQTSMTVDNTTNFKAGDVIQLSDLTSATLLTVTGFGTNGSNPTITVTAPTNTLPKTYTPGSYVFRSRRVTYSIDTTTFGANDPLLMIDPDGPGALAAQPIAEGIEDLQIAMGFDLNADGNLVSVGAAAADDDWVYNVAAETAPATLALLRAVRVTLISRPSVMTAGQIGRRPAAEDHAIAGSTDSYPRRVLRSELTVRNFNL